MYLLGLDFGGTKLAAGLWRVGAPTLTRAARCGTDVAAGAAGALRSMTDMARRLLADAGVEPGGLGGVGVSFGGHVDAEAGLVLRSVHVPGWENWPLGADLAAEFGVPAPVENDANAAALAEWRFGAGQGQPSLLYLTVSTGIGGGLVLNGEIYRGRHGMAGEIGHTVVAPNGPLCPCGRRGCLEAVAAGPAIARLARERLAADPMRPSLLRERPDFQAQEVAAAAEAGDPPAREAVDEALGYLGLGVANAVNLLDPGCVVLGGGVTRMGSPLFNRVRQLVGEHALVPCDIRSAELGDDVGVWGALAVIALHLST